MCKIVGRGASPSSCCRVDATARTTRSSRSLIQELGVQMPTESVRVNRTMNEPRSGFKSKPRVASPRAHPGEQEPVQFLNPRMDFTGRCLATLNLPRTRCMQSTRDLSARSPTRDARLRCPIPARRSTPNDSLAPPPIDSSLAQPSRRIRSQSIAANHPLNHTQLHEITNELGFVLQKNFSNASRFPTRSPRARREERAIKMEKSLQMRRK
jgi:hypothetical protein